MESISPQIDIAFKKIFGVEENKDLSMSLINSIVSKEDTLNDVTLLNPYNPKNFRNDKLSILDIKAIGENGKRYNTQIQLSYEADYDKRAHYYLSKLYTEQLSSGKDYSSLCKAIGIHILNFTSMVDSNSYHNVFHVKEKDKNLHLFSDFEIHTIELKKFIDSNKDYDKDILSFAAKIQTSLDMWSAFLTRHDLLKKIQNTKQIPDVLNKEPIEKAFDVLEGLSFIDEERQAYEDHIKWFRMEQSALKYAKELGFDEGIKEGVKEGIKQGIEEGIKQGVEEGIKQTIAKMIKKGKTISEIADLLDLPDETIKELT